MQLKIHSIKAKKYIKKNISKENWALCGYTISENYPIIANADNDILYKKLLQNDLKLNKDFSISC